MMVVRVFYVVEKLLKPLSLLVLLFTQWLVPNTRKGGDKRFLMTREFIQHVVSDPKEGARITAFERLMINRVLALQNQTAVQIMTRITSYNVCYTKLLRRVFSGSGEAISTSGTFSIPTQRAPSSLKTGRRM